MLASAPAISELNLRCETLACCRYRFVSSDRVGLHGLMGAFGPTGNNNFWGDDVWDSASLSASDLNLSVIRISRELARANFSPSQRACTFEGSARLCMMSSQSIVFTCMADYYFDPASLAV